MIITCPSCSSRFQYEEARFQGVRSKRFRCPKCDDVFEVLNPAPLQETSAALAPPPKPEPPLLTAPFTAPFQPDLTRPGQETTARKDRESMSGLRSSMPRGTRFSLAFLTGPQSSMVKLITTPQTVIGREEGDIITQDPETSRRHATLDIYPDGTVWITDLESTNGTFVDGLRVYGTTQIVDRQEITCGKSTFMLLIRQEDSLNLE